MPGQHASLSPSSAHRWLRCPASIRAIEQLPKRADESSPYAHEGTLAHALAEIEGQYHFDQISHKDYTQAYEAWRLNANLDLDTLGEMREYIRGYIRYIESRMEQYINSTVMFEQRLDSGVLGKVWGTSDVVIIGVTEDLEVVIEIIDLKYGAGHPVHPENNEQEMLYALGALDEYGMGNLIGPVRRMVLSIYQPRVFGGINSWETTVKELREWRRQVVIPTAKLALQDGAPFVPSEEACMWCPVAGDCTARAKKLAGEDFSAPYIEVQRPDLLQPEEISTILHRLPDIRKWADAVEAAAYRRVVTDKEEVPGWKAVRSGGRRYITDQEQAVEKLAEASEEYGADDFFQPKKIKGLGDLEKMVSKKGLTTILGDLLQKSEGSVSIVPDDDKRAAWDPNDEAAKDFADE
jgi:hypothetical protein